jgi:hypothetical protein
MTGLLLILKLLGGLILLFILGGIVGHLFKLDKYYEDIHNIKTKILKGAEMKMIKIMAIK